MNKRSLLILLVILQLFIYLGVGSYSSAQPDVFAAAARVPVPEISAPSAILLEAETGQTLYSKSSKAPLHISAACKLMTVLIAIENSDLYANVTASADSVVAEGSALNLEVGAKYQMIDLLHAIMLTSANDAAVAIAEHVSSGNIDKFVAKMNETAEKLKMANTNFTNPTGLYDEYQYTTAGDISLLIKYAIQNTTFNKIFSTMVRPWYGTGNEMRILTSSNDLFWSYDGIQGGKTGYNKKEQQTVISAAARLNIKLICIVLDAPKESMYSDATALFDYGFDNFRKSTLVGKGELIKTSWLNGNAVRLISHDDIMYVHPSGESYIKEFSAEAELNPPLKKAIPAGSAKYVLNDGTEVSITLYPETEVVQPEDEMTRLRKKVTDNKDIFILVAVLAAIEAMLILIQIGKLIGKLVTLIVKHIGRRSSGQR